jgi:hypothetical protein
LERSLIVIANAENVKEVIEAARGTKYVIEGQLATPIGKSVMMRTIWIFETGQERPRFVTAYPI